ncbi:MAG TPA: diguanylate cyclase [Candidatus Coatesbacteria bacterium]|nr:diguanylate cyclase [Candidatus Coatesbacteria bacterium]
MGESDVADAFREVLRLARTNRDLGALFAEVLSRLERICVCRHPRVVLYPESCPLPPAAGGGEEARFVFTLPGFPREGEKEPLFSLPLFSRGQLYGRLDIFELERGLLGESDLVAVEGFAELLARLLRDELAQLDPVTRLYNRAFFDEQLRALFDGATEAKKPLALALADLDHFKRVNDTYGHAIGDRALALAGSLVRGMATGGFAARVGGEELAVIVPGLCTAEMARRADETRARLAASPIAVPEERSSFTITSSFGVAAFPEHCRTAEELVSCADKALYAAKEGGRNLVCIFGAPAPFTAPKAVEPRPEKEGLPVVDLARPRVKRERRRTKPEPARAEPFKTKADALQRLRVLLADQAPRTMLDLSADARLGLFALAPFSLHLHGGELFIVEYYRNLVHRYPIERALAELPEQGSPRPAAGRLQGLRLKTVGRGAGSSLLNPAAVAVDDLGYLWVADSQNHEVKKFDDDGGLLQTFGGMGQARGRLTLPLDLDHDGERLIVADTGNRRLQGFGVSGRVEFEAGLRPAEGGVLPRPEKLSVGPDGRIYLLDTGANRIMVYDGAGRFQAELAGYGAGLGQFRSPTDLVATRDGFLVVAEGGDNNRLQFFDADLAPLGQLELGAVLWEGNRLKSLAPARRREPGVKSLRPWSVAATTVEELYLIDQNTNHILLLRL